MTPRTFFCGLAALLLSAIPQGTGAKPPLDYQSPLPDPPKSGDIARPDPGHLNGSVPDPIIGPGPFQRLPSIDETQWVVLAVSDKPYWTVGKADAVLTNACQIGEFQSLTLNRMVVKFDGEEGRGLLQVVPPTHRHLLLDKRRLSRPGETYYFLNSGLATCEVWFIGKGKPRSLSTTTGSSLPPTDPKALQKRKALIANWPKN
jgi:hypothetical protein